MPGGNCFCRYHETLREHDGDAIQVLGAVRLLKNGCAMGQWVELDAAETSSHKLQPHAMENLQPPRVADACRHETLREHDGDAIRVRTSACGVKCGQMPSPGLHPACWFPKGQHALQKCKSIKKKKELATPWVPTWSPTAVLTGPDGV